MIQVLGNALVALCLALSSGSAEAHSWEVTSPQHEQTFTFGSERHRAFLDFHHHLGIALDFTNDPYVDQDNPRQYDNFVFAFPQVHLGPDGRTYFFTPHRGPAVAVAVRHPGFLGSVTLLPSSFLVVEKPHGLLTLTLIISDGSSARATSLQETEAFTPKESGSSG